VEYLQCREQDTLLNILRLFFALIAKSEMHGKMIIEDDRNKESLQHLLKILIGPSTPMTRYSLKITYLAI